MIVIEAQCTCTQAVLALLVAVARRVQSEYHSRAIVHSDIKPSNVLVGKGGAITLIDAVCPSPYCDCSYRHLADPTDEWSCSTG
jgi:serine/threonine protein kinase